MKFSKASGSNTEELLGLTFPNSTPIYVSLGRNNVFVTDEAGRDIAPAPGYLSFWNLLQAASYQKDLLIEVEGWGNPTVRFNDVSFQIGTSTRPMTGIEFYENYLDAVFFKDLINPVPGDYVYNVNPRLNTARSSALQNMSIALPESAPGVYGIITRLDLDGGPFPAPVYPGEVSWDVSFMLSVARLDGEGMVDFELPEGPLHFVDAFSVEQPQGTSILVKLSGGTDTGEGWYEIISPETITLKPNP